MSQVIRIPYNLYQRLSSHAKGFDTPANVIEKILDFYEELIYSFKKVNLNAFKLLFSGRFKSFYQYTNATFLLLVMGGSMFSYFSVSIVLDYLIQNYELYVWSAFLG